ncbi:hypothetical protein HYX15_03500 [Candidatus Woesearchaeota archaeon]|nr:hypothetical protein [Candidatus Woesearchaeota archaeon]
MNEILKYYSRKDVQKQIILSSTNREIAAKYNENFGKRPDILQFESDVLELAKKGATSFHVSVEHWSNPLDLKPGMNKKQLDDLRIGWDLLIDIDCKFFDYSKIAANLLIEAIKFHGINNIGLKFSGNRSFHIGIPYNSFPKKVNNLKTNLLFPDSIKVIVYHLKNMIRDPLSSGIMELSTIDEIATSVNKPKKELMKDNIFDPFSIVQIDEMLVSSRHMYRAPYSLNEKSGLVSIPIKLNKLKNFKLSSAKLENVETNIKFLDEDKSEENESSNLIIQSFDSFNKKKEEVKIIKNKITIKGKVNEDRFPPCIQKCLKGIKTDGRKRALFILINFLRNMNWDIEDIQKLLMEWNKKNYEPLRDNYILSQIKWHKEQSVKLPPNCSNESYYKDLGIKCQENICNRVKNPINYTLKFKKPQ